MAGVDGHRVVKWKGGMRRRDWPGCMWPDLCMPKVLCAHAVLTSVCVSMGDCDDGNADDNNGGDKNGRGVVVVIVVVVPR